MLALHRWWSCSVAAALLTACPGGSDRPPPPSCTRWTPDSSPGPGDPAQRFPNAPGDRWVAHVEGSATWQWTEVTGTRTISGHQAALLRTFDLETRASIGGERYRAVDDHGVLELGNDDPGDTLTALLVPYYSARFPITVADEFTAIACSNLDFGEDLDGDGKNESLDVRLVVSAAAVETVAAPIGLVANAARIEQRLTMTVRGTGPAHQAETVEGRVTDWYAPGVGLVREVVEIPLGAAGPPMELVGYAIGGVAKGLQARRSIASTISGPYAAAFDGAAYLVAGTRAGPSVVGVRVTPGETTPAPPFDVIAIPRAPGDLVETSAPAAAAGGGIVAVVAGTWNGLGGEVRLQRIAPDGTLLEGAAGKVIGSGVSSSWAYGCGPSLASDGAGFLAVALAGDRIIGVRFAADGTVLGETAIGVGTAGGAAPLCPIVDFDGSDYLVVYQALLGNPGPTSSRELRAVHVNTSGVVAEADPVVLSSTAGTKQPIAMVFDGTAHVLLLADGRDGVSTALTLRRLTPAATWADGDAATGGYVLLGSWPSMNSASLYGETITLAATTPIIAWANGVNTLPTVPAQEVWVTRLGTDGAPLDLHDGAPGIDVYLGDPASCPGASFPLALGGTDGIPEVLYSVECGYPTFAQGIRAVRFGL